MIRADRVTQCVYVCVCCGFVLFGAVCEVNGGVSRTAQSICGASSEKQQPNFGQLSVHCIHNIWAIVKIGCGGEGCGGGYIEYIRIEYEKGGVPGQRERGVPRAVLLQDGPVGRTDVDHHAHLRRAVDHGGAVWDVVVLGNPMRCFVNFGPYCSTNCVSNHTRAIFTDRSVKSSNSCVHTNAGKIWISNNYVYTEQIAVRKAEPGLFN